MENDLFCACGEFAEGVVAEDTEDAKDAEVAEDLRLERNGVLRK